MRGIYGAFCSTLCIHSVIYPLLDLVLLALVLLDLASELPYPEEDGDIIDSEHPSDSSKAIAFEVELKGKVAVELGLSATGTGVIAETGHTLVALASMLVMSVPDDPVSLAPGTLEGELALELRFIGLEHGRQHMVERAGRKRRWVGLIGHTDDYLQRPTYPHNFSAGQAKPARVLNS